MLSLGLFLTIAPGYLSFERSPEESQSQSAAEAVDASNYPIIAVLPFNNQTQLAQFDFLEAGLQEQLVDDLEQFEIVRPIYYDRSYATLIRDSGKSDRSAAYAISGTILSVEPEVDLLIELIDLETNSILQERRIRRAPASSNYFDSLSDIIRKVSGDIAGFEGRIAQDKLSHIEAQIARGSMNLADLQLYECIVLTEKFMDDPTQTPEKFRVIYNCLSKKLEDRPDDALLLAHLGALSYWSTGSDPKFHRASSLNPDINPEDSLDMVRRAADLDPDSGPIQYLLAATIHMSGGSAEDALKHSRLAYEANSGDPLYMAALSWDLSDLGEWAEALKLAKGSRDRTPSPPANYYLADYGFALRNGDGESMRRIAGQMTASGHLYSYLYEYLAAAANDDVEGMAKHRARIDSVDKNQRDRGFDGIMYALQQTYRNEEVLLSARGLFVKAGVIERPKEVALED